jgi:hypothetical protein
MGAGVYKSIPSINTAPTAMGEKKEPNNPNKPVLMKPVLMPPMELGALLRKRGFKKLASVITQFEQRAKEVITAALNNVAVQQDLLQNARRLQLVLSNHPILTQKDRIYWATMEILIKIQDQQATRWNWPSLSKWCQEVYHMDLEIQSVGQFGNLVPVFIWGSLHATEDAFQGNAPFAASTNDDPKMISLSKVIEKAIEKDKDNEKDDPIPTIPKLDDQIATHSRKLLKLQANGNGKDKSVPTIPSTIPPRQALKLMLRSLGSASRQYEYVPPPPPPSQTRPTFSVF